MIKETKIFELEAISPIDGRYSKYTSQLKDYFSEYALIKFRVYVELKWLLFILDENSKFNLPIKKISQSEREIIYDINQNISSNINEAIRVKEIEKETNHDVKAVEYYIREKLKGTSLERVSSYIHIGCTSEDITNLAYASALKNAMEIEWIPSAFKLIESVKSVAKKVKDIPMLAHTHGQPASSTTVGKELMVFVYRWSEIIKEIYNIKLKGKFNGAVGNFNAHLSAFPEINWESVSKEFVESLDLEFNPITTQIESHDTMCRLFDYIKLFNNVTIDFNRDMWLYISMGYFKQKIVEGEVGSSTMPHKVNPINHENSESNIIMSNAILQMLSNKLPISRMQRDLSDSSSQRNIGVAIAHSMISLKQTLIGFNKMEIDLDILRNDLKDRWEILAEPIQTMLRKYGIENAYEKLKNLTRGKKITKSIIIEFISELEIPDEEKDKLLTLTPENYIGKAVEIVQNIVYYL